MLVYMEVGRLPEFLINLVFPYGMPRYVCIMFESGPGDPAYESLDVTDTGFTKFG